MHEIQFKRVSNWKNRIPIWLKEKAARKYLSLEDNFRKWIWFNNNSNSKLFFIYRYGIRVGFIQIESNQEFWDLAIFVDFRFRNRHLARKSIMKMRELFSVGIFRMTVQECNSPMRQVLKSLDYYESKADKYGLMVYSDTKFELPNESLHRTIN